MRKGGKLAEIRRENEECERGMKTFCLNPTVANRARISKCALVTRGEYYATWYSMLPYVGTFVGSETLESYNMKRQLVYSAIEHSTDSQPSKNNAMKMLYIFAATGWKHALEKFYECMGDCRIPQSSRVEMCTVFKEWKEMYALQIHELRSDDKDHFRTLGIDISGVDFSQFDAYQREYERSK